MAETSMKDIKGRIKSVENTMQITKAMELVASSKLIKAKKRAETAKPFFEILQSTLSDIAQNNTELYSVFSVQRRIKKICYVVIAGDRGMAGGYNNNLFKKAEEQMDDTPFCVLPVGRKAVDFFDKKGAQILTKQFALIENVSISDCFGLGDTLAGAYADGLFDSLCLVYTRFISMLNQEPTILNVLPFQYDQTDFSRARMLTVYDPGPEVVFDYIVPQYISGILYGAVAESLVSEQAARLTAMESASKNAGEMIDELHLKFNRARQSAITQEITEIVSGSEAL